MLKRQLPCMSVCCISCHTYVSDMVCRGPLKAALHCRLYTGDTESFRLAFHLAGKGADYAQAAHRPSAALSAQAAARGASKASSWCRKTICVRKIYDLSVTLWIACIVASVSGPKRKLQGESL